MFNISEALPCEDFFPFFFPGIKFIPLPFRGKHSVCLGSGRVSGMSLSHFDKQKFEKKKKLKHLINFCKLSDYAFAVRSMRLDEATTPGANVLALGAHKYQ